MRANRLQLAGFPTAAQVLVDELKREIAPPSKCYGRFALTETSGFDGVEQPDVSPTLDR